MLPDSTLWSWTTPEKEKNDFSFFSFTFLSFLMLHSYFAYRFDYKRDIFFSDDFLVPEIRITKCLCFIQTHNPLEFVQNFILILQICQNV